MKLHKGDIVTVRLRVDNPEPDLAGDLYLSSINREHQLGQYVHKSDIVFVETPAAKHWELWANEDGKAARYSNRSGGDGYWLSQDGKARVVSDFVPALKILNGDGTVAED